MSVRDPDSDRERGRARPARADGAALFSFEDVGVVAPDGTPTLSEVSADIASSGTTVVVGPSGAGKSTLLRLCNRLGVPSSGRVRYRGTPLEDLDPRAHRRDVGMVFQRPVTFPGTCAQNLAVADDTAGAGRHREVLGAVGLPTALLDRAADALSGGEAQRLCIARALLTDPDVLLLDEPTSALDEDARGEVEALTGRLRGLGVSLVWVTHDRAQVDRVADGVIALDRGRVVFAGGRHSAHAAGVLGPRPAGEAAAGDVDPGPSRGGT